MPVGMHGGTAMSSALQYRPIITVPLTNVLHESCRAQHFVTVSLDLHERDHKETGMKQSMVCCCPYCNLRKGLAVYAETSYRSS